MHWKLLAGLACSAALLLGACSSNNPPATGDGANNPGDGNGGSSGDGNGGSSGDGNGMDDGPTKVPAVDQAIKAANDAIAAATAEAAKTGADPARVLELVAEARRAIAAVKPAADKAVDDADRDDNDAYGLALRAQIYVEGTFQPDQKQTQLNTIENPLLWFNAKLLRQDLASGTPRIPADATNKADVTRTPRTKDTSSTDTTQIAGTADAVIKSADFAAVMYEAGKTVFSGSDDEFRVGGYVSGTTTEQNLNAVHKTGLKVTSDGLEIRSGGAVGTGGGVDSFTGDFLDMRKKIDTSVGTGISSGGWDLTIKLDEPKTVPGTRGVSSWNGNGDFYWRAIAPAFEDQLDSTKTASFTARTYTQPSGYKDLGTYEVWLSNHIGVDKGVEPQSGQTAICRPGDTERMRSCPYDDTQRYLDYAAYGMFAFIPEAAIGASIPTDRGRLQSMHFGYEAFKDETGKKTTDIGTAITSTNANFYGQSIATAFKGNRVPGGTIGAIDFERKLLRGDVELTVTIPKSTGSGTLIGTVDGFAEWNGAYWVSYTSDFKVSFDNGTDDTAITIGDGGAFTGRASLAVGTGDPFTVGNADAAGEVNSGGVGQVTGTFYGPRNAPADLEAAGSWIVGHPATSPENDNSEWKIIGSFGAKQR